MICLTELLAIHSPSAPKSMVIGAGGCFRRALCLNLLIKLLFCWPLPPPAFELGLILLKGKKKTKWMVKLKCE
jgi:hypothetical protein